MAHRNTKEIIMMKIYSHIPEELDQIGRKVVNAAYQVHKDLGPGLLEKVYEICFSYELSRMGLQVERQLYLPVNYKGIEFKEGLRLDVLINSSVICELKAIETVNPVWDAQILSHLKLTEIRLGYLINFNVPLIKDGIRRFVI